MLSFLRTLTDPGARGLGVTRFERFRFLEIITLLPLEWRYTKDMVSLEEVEAELAEGDVLEEVDASSEDEESDLEASELAELRPMDAMSLRTEELIAEMERRHLHPKGFLTDDAKELQKYFDKEYEQDLAKIKAERREERKRERKKALLHKKRLQLEKQLKDEEEAVAADDQVATWLGAIRGDLTRDTARIRCDSITARTIAKALWTNRSLTAVDLSRNKLSDFAGAQLARMLKRNRALLKLELNENAIGPRTCRALGKWLPANDVLRVLDLESNPLATDGQEAQGFVDFARALKVNSTLTSVSIWRCNVGHAAGAELAAAVSCNDSLTSLDLGNNGFYHADLRVIVDKLEENQAACNEREKLEEEKLRIAQEEQAARDAVQEEARKVRDLEAWMNEQRDDRANQRIALAEEARLQRQDLERRRLLEEQRLRDEMRAREEAAKKKKGGKKKKKKK